MPSGIAEAVRKQVAQADKTGLVLERSPYSSTGFTNVIKVKNKYQARLQMKATAERKRYQHPLPGLFDTAEEAAEYLAIVKRDFGPDGVEPPPRQNQPSKPRSNQQASKSSASDDATGDRASNVSDRCPKSHGFAHSVCNDARASCGCHAASSAAVLRATDRWICCSEWCISVHIQPYVTHMNEDNCVIIQL